MSVPSLIILSILSLSSIHFLSCNGEKCLFPWAPQKSQKYVCPISPLAPQPDAVLQAITIISSPSIPTRLRTLANLYLLHLDSSHSLVIHMETHISVTCSLCNRSTRWDAILTLNWLSWRLMGHCTPLLLTETMAQSACIEFLWWLFSL